jgi:murein DD-endopeptidase MepM/ murein hydrolase activator NlpD
VNACITSGYGPRWGTFHNGTDLGADYGTAIHAAAAGTVSTAWQAGGAGNYTMINHGDGVWTVYMHQSSFAIQSGYVEAGQIIGYVGSTGDSQGPHLHLEVHTGGLWNGRVNPVPFMADRGVNLGC